MEEQGINNVARSSDEAIYQVITSTASKLIWIKKFLMDISIKNQALI
jgi:hypothetical protein